MRNKQFKDDRKTRRCQAAVYPKAKSVWAPPHQCGNTANHDNEFFCGIHSRTKRAATDGRRRAKKVIKKTNVSKSGTAAILNAVRYVLTVDDDEINNANVALLELSIEHGLVSKDECNLG